MPEIAKTEPSSFYIGDTVQWRREDLSTNYPADLWTLTYTFINSAKKETVVASADGLNFSIEIAASTSAAYISGLYSWSAVATKSAESFTVDGGTMEFKPSFAASTTLDTRSHVKKTLDAIEAVIEGRAGKDQEEYSIAGRSLKRTPMIDLLRLKTTYESYYGQELANEKVANGQKTGRVVLARFKEPG